MADHLVAKKFATLVVTNELGEVKVSYRLRFSKGLLKRGSKVGDWDWSLAWPMSNADVSNDR